MKNIFVILIFVFLFASCTVITMEPYRSADTLGGPLHVRAGIGIQMGQLITQQGDSANFVNGDLPFPTANAYAGIGISKNIDIYGSVGITFPSLSGSLGMKFQFYDKLGLKLAVIPTFRLNNGENKAVAFGDSSYYNYNIIGGELPIVASYSILNFIILTAGSHAGCYFMEFKEDSNRVNFTMLSYGFYLMPEIKLWAFRITPSVDFRWFNVPNATYVRSTSDFRNIYPSLSLSFQF